jgi:hypothetical protein
MGCLRWWSVLSILVAATVAAQSQPDFSGRWVLAHPEAAGAGVAGALTVRQPIVRTNVHGVPMEPVFKEITVERQFGTDTQADTFQIGVHGGTVGGVVANGAATGAGPDIPQTRFFVRWEDNRLVIDTGRYSGSTREAGPYTERTEVWQLDAAGMLIVTITDRGPGAESTTRTLTYRRTR